MSDVIVRGLLCLSPFLIFGFLGLTLLAIQKAKSGPARAVGTAWGNTVGDLGFELAGVVDPHLVPVGMTYAASSPGRAGLGVVAGHRARVWLASRDAHTDLFEHSTGAHRHSHSRARLRETWALVHLSQSLGFEMHEASHLLFSTMQSAYANAFRGDAADRPLQVLADPRVAPVVSAIRQTGWTVRLVSGAVAAQHEGEVLDASALHAVLESLVQLAPLLPIARRDVSAPRDEEAANAWAGTAAALGFELERRPARLVGSRDGLAVAVDVEHHSGEPFTVLGTKLGVSLGRFVSAERHDNPVVRAQFGPAPRTRTPALDGAGYALSPWRTSDAALFDHPVVVAALHALPAAILGVLVEDDRVRLVAGGALTDPRALEEALAVLVGVAHQLRRVGGANAPFR